jgi:hypothetical protein
VNTQEVAAQVLTDRVGTTENNIRVLEARLVAAVQSIQQLRHEITIGRIERTKSNETAAERIVAGIRDEKELVVPESLKIAKPRMVKGKRKSGGGNRTKQVVMKRWALWRIQYEQGYTTRQIANAWKCNRKSIDYAREHHWGAE